MASSTGEKAKRYQFKAEVKQLLDILVHSVYTSKDIFIRELVSNAADALEKVRFSKVRGEAIHEPDAELEIVIETREEKDGKVLVIRDSGIGMTTDEVRSNLGTIAHSGVTSFIEKMKEGGDSTDLSLIGRFGIGFYSVFMAADKVVVTTRSAQPDAEAVVWTSEGTGNYTVKTAKGGVPRGTCVEVFLKTEEDRFADADTIKSTIRKYSNFVPFPVKVDGEAVNRTTALWREPSHQVTDEQYSEFYKYLCHDIGDPVMRVHFSADVPLQFSALLFAPKTSTEFLGFGEGEVSLQLYVKRVLIDAENKDLLPKYLRFVKGVVESEDLPLNVSRETLQENPFVVKMRETLTKKVLEELAAFATREPDQYADFWRASGRILKEGYADFTHRERVAELMRFNTSHHVDADGLCGLQEVVDRMPEGQESIYYLSGASRESLEQDPRLELFRKRGLEVLYLVDMADEFVLGGIGTYKEKSIVSADQVKPDDVKDLGDADEEKKSGDSDEAQPDIAPLVDRFKAILGERVTDVRISERLVDSPACLVNEEGMSSHMDKMLRMMQKDSELPKRILELNAGHAMIRDLMGIVARDATDEFVTRACEQIFEGAMLADGFLADPHRLVQRMHEILADAAAMKAGSEKA